MLNIILPLKLNYCKLFIIFFLCFVSFSQAEARPEQDKTEFEEFWQEFYVYHNISDKFSTEVLFNNLYGSEQGFYDWFVEGKLRYRLNSWVNFEAMYRHENYKLGDRRVVEYRPMFRSSLKKSVGKWSFRNRHKLEYRLFEVGESHVRYRTDLKIKPQLNWTSLKLNPYVTEEIFVAHQQYTRNRVYAGIEGKKGKIEPGAYLLLQSNNNTDLWAHRLIVGLVLGLEL